MIYSQQVSSVVWAFRNISYLTNPLPKWRNPMPSIAQPRQAQPIPAESSNAIYRLRFCVTR